MEGYYRQKLDGTRKLLMKEKKGFFWQGFRGRRGSHQAGYLSFLGGMQRAHVVTTISLAQTREFLTKITFLEKVETVLRLATKSRFSVMALAQVTPFWSCGFFLEQDLPRYGTLQVCPNHSLYREKCPLSNSKIYVFYALYAMYALLALLIVAC